MDSIAFLQKLVVSFAIGALIGLEREKTGKQIIAGMRTFSLISFFAMLSVYVSNYAGQIIVPLAFVAVILFIIFFEFMLKKVELGLTTIFSMVLSFIFGLMVGYGLFFEAISASLLTVFILLGRRKFHSFVKKLTHEKIVDAVEFAIVAFVLYPLLPSTPVKMLAVNFDLHMLWYTIVVICLLSFISFLAVKRMGNLGILASAFLGSIISSTLTIAEITKFSKKLNEKNLLTAFKVALSAMLLRNFVLVVLIAPSLTFSVGIFVFSIFVVLFRSGINFDIRTQLKFEEKKPFSVNYAVEVSLFLFFVTTFIGALKDNVVGIVLATLLGGAFNSAATVASLVLSFSSGLISAQLTKLLVCLAVIATIIPDFFMIHTFGSQEFKASTLKLVSKIEFVGLVVSILIFVFNL